MGDGPQSTPCPPRSPPHCMARSVCRSGGVESGCMVVAGTVGGVSWEMLEGGALGKRHHISRPQRPCSAPKTCPCGAGFPFPRPCTSFSSPQPCLGVRLGLPVFSARKQRGQRETSLGRLRGGTEVTCGPGWHFWFLVFGTDWHEAPCASVSLLVKGRLCPGLQALQTRD